ncbi:MAG: UDP-N-acetylmuramoyl-tripeptide--D-alanyl-D-alanine ligase [Spirochaetia bacterium]|jgi:UDP-N-acetylmuramoyl-tripeptide--D-alanyl-D-alanine ligase
MAIGTRRLFSFADVASATGGRVVVDPREPEGICSVVTDSRASVEGSLFVALRGERTDGHEFLEQVARSGAAALLVSAEQAGRRGEELAALHAGHGVGVIAVADTLVGLQDLARFHMRRLQSVTRIGITGSNGKTTTKEIIGLILSRSAATAKNEGNLNSEIGLPLSCFAVEQKHRYAVFEMGMNHRGEMGVLADIARPDLALVTNIGTAHVGILGSQDEIAKEKKKIFAHFDGRQVGLLPEDERYRAFLAEGVKGRIVLFGPKSTPGYGGSESLGLGGTLIHWEGFRVRFPLFGPYNLANALGAVSVARELGVPNAEIRDGLEAVTPLFGRSQIITGPVTVIVDCYNANPDSMASALSFLEALPWKGKKIAVLGGMRELGDSSTAAHSALGWRLRQTGLDAVFLFGEEMEHAWKAIAGSPAEARGRWTVDLSSLDAQLNRLAAPGDLILLKGSRGLELERLLPRLTSRRSDDQGETRC